MTHQIVEDASFLVLPESANLRREPPRAPGARQAGYAEKFDSKTLIYNVFRVDDQDAIVVVAPPPLNLSELFKQATFSVNGGAPISPEFRFGDRNMQVWLKSDCADPKELTFASAFGDREVRINEDKSHIFEGLRVIFTLQKDNDPKWIADWINFNIEIHGCNAVLIYDNGSTRYPMEYLLDYIQQNCKLSACVIVSWPFLYGPGGGPSSIWDSDFCQFGVLEDARWRFLRKAGSVLNSDIDELLVYEDSEGIFEKVERSRTGYIQFPGRWIGNAIENLEAVQAVAPLHRLYRYSEYTLNPCPTKWACVPAKIPAKSQWKVHSIAAENDDIWEKEKFHFRHFRSINTNWLYRRSFPVSVDSKLHEIDEQLLRAYKRLNWIDADD